MLSNIFSVAKKQTDNADGNVTVILTVWKRNYLEEQIEAIINQTVRPYQVWIYQCGDFVNTKKLRRIFPNIQWINSSINLKYFGRFSLAVYAKSDYVWILDDDVIPSRSWLSESEKMCNMMNAIISSTGRIISYNDVKKDDTIDLRRYLIGDGHDEMVCNFNDKQRVVDFGCNSWLFKKEWMNLFWKIPPYTLDNAEDIHLSATCKIFNDA